MEILQAFQTKNPSYIRNRSISPVGVFVHSTGANNKNLKRYVDAPERLGKNIYNNHWNKASANKSVHAWIGYDKDQKVIVAQTLPYDLSREALAVAKKAVITTIRKHTSSLKSVKEARRMLIITGRPLPLRKNTAPAFANSTAGVLTASQAMWKRTRQVMQAIMPILFPG